MIIWYDDNLKLECNRQWVFLNSIWEVFVTVRSAISKDQDKVEMALNVCGGPPLSQSYLCCCWCCLSQWILLTVNRTGDLYSLCERLHSRGFGWWSQILRDAFKVCFAYWIMQQWSWFSPRYWSPLSPDGKHAITARSWHHVEWV